MVMDIGLGPHRDIFHIQPNFGLDDIIQSSSPRVSKLVQINENHLNELVSLAYDVGRAKETSNGLQEELNEEMMDQEPVGGCDYTRR